MAPFRWICIYENEETSEVTSEHLTLADALRAPARPGAEVICNGATLAKAWRGHDWHLTPEGIDWQDFPEESRPKLVNGSWVYTNPKTV